jgi:electron transfer flavoprotein beta subunit
MTIAVLYKWAGNPQNASVAADGTVDWSGAKPAVSEYDTVAIEVGRQVADATGGELVGVSVGGADVASPLARKAVLGRGPDRAVLVADDATAAWNPTDVGRVLAALLGRVEGADLVLAGDVSIDEGAGIVPALTAGYLGWSCLLDVVGVARSADGWTVEQAVPGGTRTVAVTGPLVASVTTDAVKPRVPGVKDVLAAGKKPVDVVPVAGVPAPCSAPAVAGRERPEAAHRAGRTFSGGAATAELVSALRADGVL